MLIHETIRVTVCGQLEAILAADEDKEKIAPMPSELMSVIKESFVDLYEDYISTCQKHIYLDGEVMKVVMGFTIFLIG